MTRIFSHPRQLTEGVGEPLGPTDWVSIEQARVDGFADATDDHQWIHVDPARAAQGPFGTCIAHGYLILSLVNRFMPQLIDVQGVSMGVNYGCNKIRFPNSVKVGQRIRGHGEILSVDVRPDAVQSVMRVTVEVEDEERPACVAEAISRYYFVAFEQPQDGRSPPRMTTP